mmetsp:Transcript_16391/g.27463  ORF Transcript_16391/g.27463 Transcript_16391/m.27463 type:complete len:175 (-) Transcript_16391:463-987(-)
MDHWIKHRSPLECPGRTVCIVSGLATIGHSFPWPWVWITHPNGVWGTEVAPIYARDVFLLFLSKGVVVKSQQSHGCNTVRFAQLQSLGGGGHSADGVSLDTHQNAENATSVSGLQSMHLDSTILGVMDVCSWGTANRATVSMCLNELTVHGRTSTRKSASLHGVAPIWQCKFTL